MSGAPGGRPGLLRERRGLWPGRCRQRLGPSRAATLSRPGSGGVSPASPVGKGVGRICRAPGGKAHPELPKFVVTRAHRSRVAARRGDFTRERALGLSCFKLGSSDSRCAGTGVLVTSRLSPRSFEGGQAAPGRPRARVPAVQGVRRRPRGCGGRGKAREQPRCRAAAVPPGARSREEPCLTFAALSDRS